MGTPADNSFGQTKQDSVSLFLKNKIQTHWNSNLTLSQNNILSKSQNVNPAPFAAYLITDLTRVTQIQWQNDLIISDDWSAIAGGNLSHQNLNSFADFNPPEVQHSRTAGSIFTGLNGKSGRNQIQLNARYDFLDMTDAGIVGGTQKTLGLSLIWMPTDYVRFLANYGHLKVDDSPVLASGSADYDADVVGIRAQVDF